MYFRLLHDEPSGAASYLLADLAAGEAVLIDPRAADVPVLRAMLAEHRLALRWRLHTHRHHGADAALDALDASCAAREVAAGSVLPFGDEHLQVLATPGHTAQCLSFRWRDRLFCGGLLAVEGCAEQAGPAEPRALWDSVTTQLFALPGETLLFSGQAGRATPALVSTVHDTRRRHPWFAHGGRDEFLARLARLPSARARRPDSLSTLAS